MSRSGDGGPVDPGGRHLLHAETPTSTGGSRPRPIEVGIGEPPGPKGSPPRSNSSPHIALLTLSAAAPERGGVEVFNDQFRAALGNVEIIEDGPSTRAHWFGEPRLVGLDPPARALAAARTLLRRHREVPFDLVISNGVAGWPLGLARLRIPQVQVYHLTIAGLARQALALRGDRVTTGRVTALFDRVAGVGKVVVAVSPRVLREVESYYRLRGRCIPPGVDASLFSPVERTKAREALGLPLEGPIGLFAGRPDYSKGFDILQRIARRRPDILFLAVGGNGPRQGNLLPVGRIPHSQMPLWYSAADFLVNPSRYEGFNLVILEALACDRPVVASAAAFSIPEPRSHCGVVVPGEDEEDYVRAIRDVLKSGPPHPRRVVIPRYSFDRFVTTWQDLVESLTGRRPDSSDRTRRWPASESRVEAEAATTGMG